MNHMGVECSTGSVAQKEGRGGFLTVTIRVWYLEQVRARQIQNCSHGRETCEADFVALRFLDPCNETRGDVCLGNGSLVLFILF